MARRTRAWGWHELDPSWCRRLVADAGLPPGALVLDVGAGRGALTAALLNADVRVVAFELHPGRAATMKERFGAEVKVVRADAGDLRLPRRPFHVVANPPFAVTSALIRRLVSPGSRLSTAHLIVQRQAAERWAGPAAPSRARWERTFEITVGRPIPRRAFRPPPGVDTVVVAVRRR